MCKHSVFNTYISNPIFFDMHSLEDLTSGKLKGFKELRLHCNLKEFPEEIITLADTLEFLDLSDNQISELPDNIIQLKKLKIIFFERNHFTELPAILGKLPLLEMIGFKSNKITTIPENAFPKKLRWLVLTNNQIKKLPKSIGDCQYLQKFTFAGNHVETLPSEMSRCKNLELFRVSVNRLKELPAWLFELPKLSWIGFGGNPLSYQFKLKNDLASYDWKDFMTNEVLGKGASGIISKANWVSKEKEVAVKIFKGSMTSDGLPEDEMKISIGAGYHKNLIPILGKINNHPENKQGLIMELIPTDFKNLGNPPNLQTCTRDTFNASTSFTFQQLLTIAKSITSVCCQLHEKGINHGDLYAHNILINNTSCILGDFGAAAFYNTKSEIADNIQRIEVRALGCLLEDILHRVKENNIILDKQWKQLIHKCMISDVKLRPSFNEISTIIESIEISN